ncbi:MAG: VanW family protein [Lachnospiraceae bacterium]|nr:VanW family protein [Lachnospiraceae bacterium]
MKKYIRLLPVLILVFTVGFVGHSLMTVDAVEEDIIPNTVYIGDIDVSGMTKEEAQMALNDYLDSVMGTAFTLSTGEKSICVTAEDLGLSISNMVVIDEALNLGKSGNLIARYKDKKDLEKEPKTYEIQFAADETKIETLLGVNMENLTQAAVDGSLTREGDSFIIVDGVNGVEVNVEESVDIIDTYIEQEWAGKDATIALATNTIEPRGSKEQLSKVQDLLGSYGTDYSTSAAGRRKNVENGCSKINGTLLYPGDQFSVYEMVNPFTAENGYELAGSYENGTTVQSYGGGICQVSTTLYNAVILAELQIDERWNHSMIVSYVEPSMDAAIAGTSKDLKFTNNTDAPIYIEGYTVSSKVYFNIYGEETRPENREVSYISEVLSETPAGVTFQADPTRPIGHLATMQSAHTGYTAKLWKVVTVDGEEESREEFNSSRYNPSNRVVAVGVAGDNPDAIAHMHSAIATGDELTVKVVAAQYRGDAAAQAAAQAEMDARNAAAAAAAAAAPAQ